ncbi:MAG: hypothetical protein U9M96_00850 [Thermodesulfobacteriota bacterium]|nr:hypothetical protein [Thermodesulfobacteriota bacterium]
MAEIKSTLDIIMEKTNNLTMTEEEKEELRRTELAEKAKGWVQKYMDNLIKQEKLKSELKKEGKDKYSELQKILKNELLERLQPDGDNVKIFQLIKGILDIKKDPFVKIINEFQKEVASEKSNRLENRKKLLTKRRFFGSAVIPNLALDESWGIHYKKLEVNCKKRLISVTDN